MRSSRWLPVAGWCLATATSIVLSSVALLPVLNAARADPGALPDLDRALPVPAPAASTLPSPVPEAPSAASPSAAPSSARPAPASRTPSRTPTTKPATKAATMPPTTTEDGWTVTDSDGEKTYVRSFRVEGGQAVIKVTGAGVVSVVTATPADGYSVQQTQNTPDNLAIYFIETGHHFIIHVTWFNGAPFAQVSEVGS